MLRKQQEAGEDSGSETTAQEEAEGLVRGNGAEWGFAQLSGLAPLPSPASHFPFPGLVFPYLSKKSQTGDLRNLFECERPRTRRGGVGGSEGTSMETCLGAGQEHRWGSRPWPSGHHSDATAEVSELPVQGRGALCYARCGHRGCSSAAAGRKQLGGTGGGQASARCRPGTCRKVQSSELSPGSSESGAGL